MIDAHLASGRACTVAAIRQPIALANQFGVIEQDRTTPSGSPSSSRSRSERSASPTRRARCSPPWATTSSTADALIEAVLRDGEVPDSNHDMGGDIVPDFVGARRGRRLRPHPQRRARRHRADRYYWRDVGTDRVVLRRAPGHSSRPARLQPLQPRLADLQPAAELPPAKFVRDAAGNAGTVSDSIVSLGCVISGGGWSASVLGSSVTVDSGAVVETRSCSSGRRSGRAPRCEGRSSTRTSVVAPGANVGVDVDADACGDSRSPRRHHRGRQGRRRRVSRFLVVLDVDSTLIEDEVIELIADRAGPGSSSPR